MTILYFSTPTELDIDAALTMGVSAKNTSHPIGQFGTGLKYAIAVLLRTGHSVTIATPSERIAFSTQKHQTRGQDYEVVMASRDGGVPRSLGFSTNLGARWEIWMAYRELWSNTQDEGGSITTSPLAGAPGTVISVAGAGLAQAHFSRQDFLLEGRQPIGEWDRVKVFPGRGIFYRGILVDPVPSAWAYDLQATMELTEDRTLKSRSLAWIYLRNALLACDQEGVIGKSLENVWESEHISWQYCTDAPSPTFMEAARQAESRGKLSDGAAAFVHRNKPPELEAQEPTPSEAAMLEEGRRALRAIGIEVPIPTVAILRDGVMGLAKDGATFIARSTFIQGQTRVTSTMLEEHLHATHGLADCSRHMQDWLLDKIATLAHGATGAAPQGRTHQ